MPRLWQRRTRTSFVACASSRSSALLENITYSGSKEGAIQSDKVGRRQGRSHRHAEVECRAGGGWGWCSRSPGSRVRCATCDRSPARATARTSTRPRSSSSSTTAWAGIWDDADHYRQLAADKDNATVVPVGGGVGRVLTVGGQALNAQVQGFYNAVRPDFAPKLTFLFPK